MPRFVLVLLIALAPAPAAAVTCDAMIADLRGWLDAHPHVSGTARQTVDAQLQHQPTAASVAKAKMESRDHLVELLGEAQRRQRGGDMAGCEATLADVERMIKP
jgi:hypothetical protein